MINESFLGLRNSCLPFLALSLVALAIAQDKHGRIGEIEFYGYAGFDLEKVREALPLREGDDLGDSESAFFETNDRIDWEDCRYRRGPFAAASSRRRR